MERVYSIPSENVTGAYGMVEFVRDNAPTLGWEVYDDSVDSSHYVVLKSTGHDKNNDRLPCYIKVRSNNSIYLVVDMWLYWNNVSHTGRGFINYSTPTTYNNNCVGLGVDASTANGIAMRGNKDFILFENLKPSNTTMYRCLVCRIDNPFWDYMATTVSGAGPGSNVILPLGENEPSQFTPAKSYRIISPTGYVEKVKVLYTDTANDTMTVDKLSCTMVSGTKIGSIPYPWASLGAVGFSESFSPVGLTNNVDYYNSSTAPPVNYNSFSLSRGMPGATNSYEFLNHNIVAVEPYLFYEPSYGRWGTSSYIQYLRYGADGDIVGINQADTGIISYSSSTEITGVVNTWLVDALSNMYVIITSGTEINTIHYIVSNTLDTLTVDPPFNTGPIVGDTFTVCETFYRAVTSIGFHTYFGIKDS